jgi:murein DD-endopeptidase MepM/ murein hydrolase activator NlpD
MYRAMGIEAADMGYLQRRRRACHRLDEPHQAGRGIRFGVATSHTRNNPLNFMDPTGQKECIDPDANGCKVTLPHEPSPPAPPPFIPAVPPFGSLPFDPSQVGSNSMQGFGDTTYAYDNRDSMYSYLGRLHGGWDIPLSSGTSLFSLGLGTVVCVGESCGLAAGSGNGLGIAIRYDSCNCVVFYTHLATINEGLTVDSSVVRGIEIGTSGTDVTGYPHLHLEIRPKHDVLTFYNPLYFFSRQALRLIPKVMQPTFCKSMQPTVIR